MKVVAEKMVEKEVGTGQIIIHQGGEADFLYFIYSGQVTITRRQAKQEQNLAYLVAGDHFGEDALLKHTHRSATVTAKEQTHLLAISQQDLNMFLSNILTCARNSK